MTVKQSGQQIAAANIQRFRNWIQERDKAGDWGDYARGEKLSRSDIAQECGFAVSVLRQNPTVKSELEALEARLRGAGVLCTTSVANTFLEAPNDVEEASDRAVSGRLVAAKASAEQRIKTLEETNAAQRGEIAGLRAQLKAYRHIEEHLASTGKLIRP